MVRRAPELARCRSLPIRLAVFVLQKTYSDDGARTQAVG
jgi:hypothetical protein